MLLHTANATKAFLKVERLGGLADDRFLEARQVGQSREILVEHWSAALQAYEDALAMMPSDAVDALAAYHNELGIIWKEAKQTEQAVAHYREAIRYKEQAGNFYGAATTRLNVAIAYAQAGHLDDALLFARAALHILEQFGSAAADPVAQGQQLIAWIEQRARGGRERQVAGDRGEAERRGLLATLAGWLRGARKGEGDTK
jgi:tetratricopeptide (TPR) repeat protein